MMAAVNHGQLADLVALHHFNGFAQGGPDVDRIGISRHDRADGAVEIRLAASLEKASQVAVGKDPEAGPSHRFLSGPRRTPAWSGEPNEDGPHGFLDVCAANLAAGAHCLLDPS